ncbi:NADP-dependent oxidoreductase [Allohahella sp. A8]|uniref:NADP-dependent oxidoreductase n=1 Tax=Allohahella sp. A8 TaxID=3141461 RepID=UPI003A80FA56
MTMKAWQIHSFGDADVLSLDDVQKPELAEDELLVRIRATSINPVDCKIREGKFPKVGKDDLPVILGRDVAGEVEKGNSNFEAGERVFGIPSTDRGTYAEYIAMKPSEVAKIPNEIDFAVAAGVPLVALTAWQGLFDHGELKDGERVLINGAAGGVGHLAIQFAKQAGATVFATGRRQDKQFLQELGADRAIDTDNESLDVIGDKVDLVFDLLGGEIGKAAWQHVKDNGRVISTVEELDAKAAGKPGVKTAFYLAEPNGEQLAKVASMMKDGSVKLTVEDRVSFSDIPKAQRELENAHTQGKIVVEMA